jgi:DNA transposition AAA+ family ATPase
MTTTQRLAQSSQFAPLKNIALMFQLSKTLINRPAGLPGIGVFYGPSGFGKTFASIYTQTKTEAVRIEIGESWTNKRLLEAILRELGETRIRGTIAALAEMTIERLSEYPDQPLIIDEADKLIDKRGALELVRELHEHSQVPVILIGEENLARKLEPFERVHNRVLQFVGAQLCDADDAGLLAKHYCPDLTIERDLLERICDKTNGRARRITTTLVAIQQFAINAGLSSVGAAQYDGEIVTGASPSIRQVGR